MWIKTEEKFRKRWERWSERQRKQKELAYTGSQRGKTLVTSRNDYEVKGMRMTSEVHTETAWKGGVAITLQWTGAGSSLEY